MLIPIGFFVKGGLFTPKSGLTTRTNWSGTYFATGTTAKYIFLPNDNSNVFYTSLDGTTWTTSTAPNTGSSGGGVASNGSVVVFAKQQTAYSSTNGTTWTNRGSIGGGNNRIIWDGSRFLSPSQSQLNAPLYYSNSGTSWLSVGNIFSGIPGLNIGFDGTSRYVLTRTGSSTAARTCTTDPTVLANWSAITLPSSGVWAGIAYGAGIWVLTRAGSAVYATSTNGTTWTSRTLPSLFSETTADLGEIIFANGKFWYYYSDSVYYSTDGITWVAETVNGGNLDNVATWIYDGTWLRGFGSDSTTISATTYIEGVI